jgi:hypothetical protein
MVTFLPNLMPEQSDYVGGRRLIRSLHASGAWMPRQPQPGWPRESLAWNKVSLDAINVLQ